MQTQCLPNAQKAQIDAVQVFAAAVPGLADPLGSWAERRPSLEICLGRSAARHVVAGLVVFMLVAGTSAGVVVVVVAVSMILLMEYYSYCYCNHNNYYFLKELCLISPVSSSPTELSEACHVGDKTTTTTTPPAPPAAAPTTDAATATATPPAAPTAFATAATIASAVNVTRTRLFMAFVVFTIYSQ